MSCGHSHAFVQVEALFVEIGRERRFDWHAAMAGAARVEANVQEAPCGEAGVDELLSSALDCHPAEVVGGEAVEEVFKTIN